MSLNLSFLLLFVAFILIASALLILLKSVSVFFNNNNNYHPNSNSSVNAHNLTSPSPSLTLQNTTSLSKIERSYARILNETADARILAWTTFAGKPNLNGFIVDFCPELSGKKCVVSHHRPLLNDSALLLFSSTDLDPDDFPPFHSRDPLQPWVLFTEVSPVEHPPPYHILDPNLTRLFDLTMSYRHDSDFPISPIAGSELITAISQPVNYAQIKSRFEALAQPNSPVLWITHVCKSDNHREVLVEAIESLGIPVDTVGSWGPCSSLGKHVGNEAADVVKLMRAYKFVLVLETSNCDGYYSRSLLHALQAQTIVIVDGPTRDSYKRVFPSLGSRMMMADAFESPMHLGHAIQRLTSDHSLYMNRFQPLNSRVHAEWSKIWSSPALVNGRRSGWCGLCKEALDSDRVRHQERAYQLDLAKARALEELRLAEQLAHVDKVNRNEVSKIIAMYPTTAASTKLPKVHNASQWKSMLPVPLPKNAHMRQIYPPPRHIVVPDYSCTLGKWAQSASPHLGIEESKHRLKLRYHETGRLPLDYLDHLFFDPETNIQYPRRLPKRAKSPSALSDLVGNASYRAKSIMNALDSSAWTVDAMVEPDFALYLRALDFWDGVLVGLLVTGLVGMVTARRRSTEAAEVPQTMDPNHHLVTHVHSDQSMKHLKAV